MSFRVFILSLLTTTTIIITSHDPTIRIINAIVHLLLLVHFIHHANVIMTLDDVLEIIQKVFVLTELVIIQLGSEWLSIFIVQTVKSRIH